MPKKPKKTREEPEELTIEAAEVEEEAVGASRKPRQTVDRPQKFREAPGLGSVPADAVFFSVRRVVGTGSESCMAPNAQNVMVGRWPIALLSADFIRSHFGTGDFRVQPKDARGKGLGFIPFSFVPDAKPEAPPPVLTQAHVELEIERMKFAQAKEVFAMQEKMAHDNRQWLESVIARLVPSAAPPAGAPVDVKAEIERALSSEREKSDLKTRLAVLEAGYTPAEDDDDDEEETKENPLGQIGAILEAATPIITALGPILKNPVVEKFIELKAIPYLNQLAIENEEKMAEEHERAEKRRAEKEAKKRAKESAPDTTPPSEPPPTDPEPPIVTAAGPVKPGARRARKRKTKANGAGAHAPLPPPVSPPPTIAEG